MLFFLKFSHMLVILLIVNSCISFTKASSIVDIYLDNQASSSSQDGTSDNPYLSLDGIFNELSSTQYDTAQINVHIAHSPQSYDLEGANYQIDGQSSNNISLVTWTNDLANQLSQDLSTVSLNLKNSTLEFNNLLLLSISNFIIAGQNGLISVKNSNIAIDQTTLDVPNVQDDALIEIKDSESVDIRTLNIAANAYSSFITFTNNNQDSEPSVLLENILIKLNFSTETSDSSLSVPALLSFKCKSVKGTFTANDIRVETSDESTSLDQIKPTILDVSSFDKAYLTSFIISNQFYNAINLDSTISFNKINKLNISNTLITANELSATYSLFSVKDTTNLYFQDFEVSSNNIIAPNTTNLDLVYINNVQDLQINNQTFSNNSITGRFTLSNLESEDDSSSLKLQISDIAIVNNLNSSMDCQFNYLRLAKTALGNLLINNVTFTNNQIFGTVFSFNSPSPAHKSAQHAKPRILNFTKIIIQGNQQLYDLSFIDFTVPDKIIQGSSCIQLVEPYALWIQDLEVTDNAFAKGTSDLFTTEINLFRSQQAQVFLQAPNIVNNTFEYYNFVSIENTPSTIIINSAHITNNTLHSSQLLNTHFVNTDILCDPFKGNNKTTMRMLYRYTFIMDSVISDMILDSSTLFNNNNGLSVLTGNDFKNINLTDSDFMTTKFKPLNFLPNVQGYARDTNIEELTIGYNLQAWEILNNNITRC